MRDRGTIGEDDFAVLFAAHYEAVLAYGARRVDVEIGREDAAVVRAAMAGLSARDREVLALFGWERLDQRAIAEVLGCSIGAVKVRLHRARRRLADAVTRGAPDPPGHSPGESTAARTETTGERARR